MLIRLTLDEREDDVDRILKTDLRADQNRERTIRAAFLQITLALSARPSAKRSIFDNASRERRPSTPWEKTQAAIRAAARAAARDGRPLVISETRSRIEAFYDALRADALSALPAEADLCVIQAAIEETKSQGPADVAGMELLKKPTCRTRLLDYASAVRAHVRRALAAASAAENRALNPQTTGLRQWN